MLITYLLGLQNVRMLMATAIPEITMKTIFVYVENTALGTANAEFN